jgi:hypothetical protein
MEIGSRRVLGHDLWHPACGADIRLLQELLVGLEEKVPSIKILSCNDFWLISYTTRRILCGYFFFREGQDKSGV